MTTICPSSVLWTSNSTTSRLCARLASTLSRLFSSARPAAPRCPNILIGIRSIALRMRYNLRMQRHIAVIGGGMAGTAAAYALQKRGYKVTILEREQRLGGRIHSVTLDGIEIE